MPGVTVPVGKKNPPFGGLKTPFGVGGVMKIGISAIWPGRTHCRTSSIFRSLLGLSAQQEIALEEQGKH